MNYSFKLLNVKCNAVLSTDDSPWGALDGIRIYFVAFTASGDYNVIESGKEFPESDVRDNYSFQPGKQIELEKCPPPRNASDWETDLFDVGENDIVRVAVIGINEGLAYVGGGGGSAESHAVWKILQEFFKEEAVMAAGFEAINQGLEALNNVPDCRGVAFAYEMEFNGAWLLSNHLKQKSRTIILGSPNAIQGLAIANLPRKSDDCGKPGYEVSLKITRQQQLLVALNDSAMEPRQGPPKPFNPVFTPCARKLESPAYIWAILHDRTISLQPNFLWTKMIWVIEDQEIHDSHGFVKLKKEVYIPVDAATLTKTVTVEFDVSTVGVINRLTLKTNGDDGNYSVKVKLLLKFRENQPPTLFYENDLYIIGQEMDGNDAYHDYVDCLAHFKRVFSKYARRHVRIHPGDPVEEVIRFERDLRAITKVLNGEMEIQDVV